MKTIRANHLYEVPALYEITHGSTPTDRVNNVSGFMCAIEMWMEKRNFSYTTGLDVLELFSGNSEHKKYFLDQAKFKVGSYKCIDIVPQDSTDVVVADVRKDKLPKAHLIVGYYLSANSIMDDSYKPTRKIMLETFRNIHASLKPDGAFVLDFFPNGNSCLESLNADPEQVHDFRIPYFHSMRTLVKFPESGRELRLKYKSVETYDRKGLFCDETLSNILVYSPDNKKTVARITLNLPLRQRYWTEPELVEIAKEVGFTDAIFMHVANEVKEEILLLSPVEVQKASNRNWEQMWSSHICFIK